MADAPATKEQTARRTRSPNFPAITLEQAIQRAKTIWDQEKKHATSLDVLARHWGYKDFGVSGAIQVLAALRAYGLVEVEGPPSARKAKLSESGLDILLLQPDDPKRRAAIANAAKSPTIYAELLQQRQDGQLPSDANLTSHLTRAKGFNPKAVPGFLEGFHATIAFAERESGDILSSESGVHAISNLPKFTDSQPDFFNQAFFPPNNKMVASTPNPPPANSLPLPVLMDDGTVRVIQIPRMTSRAFEFFKQQLEAYKPAIVQAHTDSNIDKP